MDMQSKSDRGVVIGNGDGGNTVHVLDLLHQARRKKDAQDKADQAARMRNVQNESSQVEDAPPKSRNVLEMLQDAQRVFEEEEVSV